MIMQDEEEEDMEEAAGAEELDEAEEAANRRMDMTCMPGALLKSRPPVRDCFECAAQSLACCNHSRLPCSDAVVLKVTPCILVTLCCQC